MALLGHNTWSPSLGHQTAVWGAFIGQLKGESPQLVEGYELLQILVVNVAIDLDTTFQIQVAPNLKVVRGWE